MCAGSCDSVAAVFVAVDQDVTQVIVQAELQETVTGACDGPSIFLVVFYDQAVILCAVSESAIVVCASSGAVLDSQEVIMVVHHLMQQCGTDFLNGTGKCTGANVDLVGCALLADPGVLTKSEVAVSLGSGLDGDRRP